MARLRVNQSISLRTTPESGLSEIYTIETSSKISMSETSIGIIVKNSNPPEEILVPWNNVRQLTRDNVVTPPSSSSVATTFNTNNKNNKKR